MADKLKILTDSEKKLHQYVADGKLEGVRQILNEPSVRVDCLDEHGMTPLMQAAFKGQFAVCELLLARGADVNSNYHDSGYTALMFAGLSGNVDVTRLMLEAGAKTHVTNNVGRNAAQMAAFVSQHQCVSLINNFFSREQLEYYTVPHDLETEARLPAPLAQPLHKFILTSNLSPVKLALYLSHHPELVKQSDKVARLLDFLCEKVMKARETNEVMGVKFHYLMHVVKEAGKQAAKQQEAAAAETQEATPPLRDWLKWLMKRRPADGFPTSEEMFVRTSLRDFPYMENQLIRQLLGTIAKTAYGAEPTALSVLTNGINGQRMASEDDHRCETCADFHAPKRCKQCNMVYYCNQECQKLHWKYHKIDCPKLKVAYEQIQKQKEEDAKKEALKKEDKEKEEKEKLAKEAEKESDLSEVKLEEKMDKVTVQEQDLNQPQVETSAS